MKAIWNGQLIAESNHTITLEGNVYFPERSVNKAFLEASNKHTICPWKGKASYYNIAVNGTVNVSAAWYYPEPSDKAKQIKGHIAFWRGVEITE